MLKELAALVRSGSVSPEELVQRSIDRIEATRHLNAVTDMWAEDALAEARTHPRTGELAGLPVLVKDMVRIEGRRTTFGSTLFADAPPDTFSDVIIDRLRAAGAIILEIGRAHV